MSNTQLLSAGFFDLYNSKPLRFIVVGLFVVIIGIYAYKYYSSTTQEQTCIPTPLLTEQDKFWLNGMVIGGPKTQWKQTQDKNVYVFSPKIENAGTKNVKASGYDMSVPEKSILVATVADLNNKCKTQQMVAYGKAGNFIQGNFKVTAATLYTNIEKFDDSMSGKWGILNPQTNQLEKIAPIGMAYKDPQPICESKTIGMTATGLGDNTWQYNGKPNTFALRKQDAMMYFDGQAQEVQSATGPAVLQNISAATIYCGK